MIDNKISSKKFVGTKIPGFHLEIEKKNSEKKSLSNYLS